MKPYKELKTAKTMMLLISAFGTIQQFEQRWFSINKHHRANANRFGLTNNSPFGSHKAP